MIIHNQIPDIELVSPVYACQNVACYSSPDRRVDVGSTTQVGFNIIPDQDIYINSFTYKLKRKDIGQSNEKDISNEDETCIRFFVTWAYRENFIVFSFLTEHDKSHALDEYGLVKINVDNGTALNHASSEYTYLMYDNTALIVRIDKAYEEEYYKIDITISKTSIKYDTRRLWYVDMDR
jgi:hypothetical protein